MAQGLLDTSVVIDLAILNPDALPDEMAISAITLAELSAGPHATDDPTERSVRQDRLQAVASAIDALPVDTAVARAFGRVYAHVVEGGATPRRRRSSDLVIAATALAAGLPLYTRNPQDFRDLQGLITVVGV